MTTAPDINIQHLFGLLNGISKRDPTQRKADIGGLKSLLNVMSSQQVNQVITMINDPADLRFLIPAGVTGVSSGFLQNKLNFLAAKGLV